MLTTEDLVIKIITVQKTGREGRKKKVCFLEYYGMKYTVGSQNSFP